METNQTNGVMLNKKEVDMTSLEVDGVDPKDYPDFNDVFFSYGQFKDGTLLTDEELELLNERHGDLAWDYAFENCVGMADYNPYDD